MTSLKYYENITYYASKNDGKPLEYYYMVIFPGDNKCGEHYQWTWDESDGGLIECIRQAKKILTDSDNKKMQINICKAEIYAREYDKAEFSSFDPIVCLNKSNLNN